MLRVVDSVQDAADLLTWLSERRPIVAMDTETSGLNVYEPGFRVRLLQIGDADSAWVIPFEQWRGLVDEILRKYDGTWALHNAAYDLSALHAVGVDIPWSRVDDTMIAVRIAEPQSSAGLKEASVRHVAAGSALSQHDLHHAMAKNRWTWDTVPIDFPPYILYAAQDVILTSRLHQHPVAQRAMASPVFALEMQVLAICSLMSQNGMRVDLDYAATEAKILRETTVSITDRLKTDYDLSPGSTQQLSKWMLEQGAKITEMTPSGAPSMAKKQLVKLLFSENPAVVDVARSVLAFRKAEKLAGTYLEGFMRMADGDGFLHAQMNTLAARTSRMSIREPALQTLPKPNDDPQSRLVRKAIIPRNEGEVILSADYAQIEARITASISDDTALIEAFRVADEEGGDFFAEMGKVVFKDPGFVKKDPRRQVVKSVLYGLMYGAGAAKLAETAGIPEHEAAEARTSILSSFPGLNSAMKRYEREASGGEVTNHYGRRLEVEEGKSYTGLNTVIQSDGADCLKRAMVLLAQAGLDGAMVVPVHDEIVVSVPAADVEEVQHIMRETMRVDDFAVPIPAEPSAPLLRWADDE